MISELTLGENWPLPPVHSISGIICHGENRLVRGSNQRPMDYKSYVLPIKTLENDILVKIVFVDIVVQLHLTIYPPKSTVISLCHQYRARLVCTSVKSNQALYCWLTNFKLTSWYPWKWYWTVPKMVDYSI